MYRFEDLEALYKSIISAEEALKEFSGYALYELDDGIVIWGKAKKIILQNIAEQKRLLRKLAAKGNFSAEQQKQVKDWKLD